MKTVLIVGGSVIALIAILNMFDIPLEFPTKSNVANLVIGGAVIGSAFVLAV